MTHKQGKNWFKRIAQKPLIKKWFFFLLGLPWFLAAIILVGFEARSFHLKDTWRLSRDERRIYFVKREFNSMGNEFDDDYFELLRKARSIISPSSLPFEWNTGESVRLRQIYLVTVYAHFWLAPERRLHFVRHRVWRNFIECSQGDVVYKIYYQKEPDSEDTMIIHKIHGKPPSYITKVVK